MKQPIFLSFLMAAMATPRAEALKIYKIGNTADASISTTQATCLAGGGNDDKWAEGWKYMLSHAKGGDVVIIRTGGERGGYDSWLLNDEGKHGFAKVNSVTTLSFEKADDANLPEVEEIVNKAEMVFFSGGDQTKYIEWFQNSRLQKAVEAAISDRKITVGGTSAGMVLLAGTDFVAKYDSPAKKGEMVTANDVLRDPTGSFVDLNSSVITGPFMKNVITDTHFSQRNRQGRLVGFMARAVYNNPKDLPATAVKGIGADEETALCYDDKGKAQVFGTGHVFFLKGHAAIEQIEPGKPLHWYANQRAIEAYVISGTDPQASFDLKTWSGLGGQSQRWSVDGKNHSFPILNTGNNFSVPLLIHPSEKNSGTH